MKKNQNGITLDTAIFSEAEKEIEMKRNFKANARGKHCNGNTKAVIIIEDGLVFTSSIDTAEHLTVSQSCVSYAARTPGATCKGKHIFYVNDLPNNVYDLCKVIQTLNKRNNSLTADAKGMEAEITRLREELAEAKVLNSEYAAKEAKRKEMAELRRRLTELESEIY